MILNTLAGKALPFYGNGALVEELTLGLPGATYNIGGHNEKCYLQVVDTLCNLLDEMVTHKPAGISHLAELITFVQDRTGYDRRDAIDGGKIERGLD